MLEIYQHHITIHHCTIIMETNKITYKEDNYKKNEIGHANRTTFSAIIIISRRRIKWDFFYMIIMTIVIKIQDEKCHDNKRYMTQMQFHCLLHDFVSCFAVPMQNTATSKLDYPSLVNWFQKTTVLAPLCTVCPTVLLVFSSPCFGGYNPTTPFSI